MIVMVVVGGDVVVMVVMVVTMTYLNPSLRAIKITANKNGKMSNQSNTQQSTNNAHYISNIRGKVLGQTHVQASKGLVRSRGHAVMLRRGTANHV